MKRLSVAVAFTAMIFGGWSASAVSLDGPVVKGGGDSCCSAPRNTSFTFDPNNTPVVATGWVDVTDVSVGSAILLGFIDAENYDNAGSSFMSGAYIYVNRPTASTLWVGPSDGNIGGEIVQEFDIPANETYLDFVLTVSAGTISVDWSTASESGGPIVDTYGDVKTLNNSGAYSHDEFEFGAYLGVDIYMDSVPGTVDFHIEAVPEPGTAALVGLGAALLAARRRARRA